MSRNAPFWRIFRDWEFEYSKIRVFERILHDDKWTSAVRYPTAKQESFATSVVPRRGKQTSYMWVLEVKVLDVFCAFVGFC